MTASRAGVLRDAGTQAVIIGVDVGGTKTRIGAVSVTADHISNDVLIACEARTPCCAGNAFYDQLAEQVRGVRAQARQAAIRVLPLIAMAHPGRFLADGTVAAGTTPNLGTFDGEFDGMNPAEELRRRLGGLVVAENDAVAQMRFGLHALLVRHDMRADLAGRTVVYFGIGTGMGGGVATISAGGDVAVATDGHLFDMLVPGYGDGCLTAEELLTGPAISGLVREANHRLPVPIEPPRASRLSQILSDPHALPEHRQAAEQIAERQGEILARMIQTVREGRIVKVRLERRSDGQLVRHQDEPDRAWPEADRFLIRGASRFLLGGWTGADPALGGCIRAHALSALQQAGITDVDIVQLPVDSADAGVLGVAHAISREEIRRALTLRS